MEELEGKDWSRDSNDSEFGFVIHRRWTFVLSGPFLLALL